MPGIRRWYCWGASALAVLHHFSSREIKAINKECRRLIRAFMSLYNTDEGYLPSTIPLIIFEYQFKLEYSYERELWTLELYGLPDFDAPICRRRRPKGGLVKNERVARWGELVATVRDWFAAGVAVMNGASSTIGPRIAAFLSDRRTMATFQPPRLLWRSLRRSQREFFEISDPLTPATAQASPFGCEELVQLVRTQPSGRLAFIGPLWSFELPRWDGLWDPAWFGVPEHVSG